MNGPCILELTKVFESGGLGVHCGMRCVDQTCKGRNGGSYRLDLPESRIWNNTRNGVCGVHFLNLKNLMAETEM